MPGVLHAQEVTVMEGNEQRRWRLRSQADRTEFKRMGGSGSPVKEVYHGGGGLPLF